MMYKSSAGLPLNDAEKARIIRLHFEEKMKVTAIASMMKRSESSINRCIREHRKATARSAA